MFKNKLYLFLIIFLLLTNVATLLFFSTQSSKTNNYYYLKLENETKSWKLSNFEIIITPEKIKVGNGKIYYLGNLNDIEDATFFDYKLYVDNLGGKQMIQNKTIAGPPIYDAGFIETGSIESLLIKNENKINIGNFKNIYAVIKWETKDGQIFEEKMNLWNN